MKVRQALALALAAAAASLLVTASATADGATVVRVPFTVSSFARTLIAACAGEQVNFTGGEFNIVFTSQVGPSGNEVDVFHRNVVRGTGTGQLTGAQYFAEGHLQDVVVDTARGNYVETFVVLLTVHNADNSIRWISPIVEHVTVTSTGLTSEVDMFTINCLTH